LPINTLFVSAVDFYFVEDMEDRAVVMEEDMEDTTSSSHTSSQHSRLQEDTVSNTAADMVPLLLHPRLLPLQQAPTLLSSRLLMPSTTVTNTAAQPVCVIQCVFCVLYHAYGEMSCKLILIVIWWI
jgi:hypothetical protein